MAAFACGCEPDTDEEPERGELSWHPIPSPLEELGQLEDLLATDFRDPARGESAGKIQLVKAEWLCEVDGQGKPKLSSAPPYERVPRDAVHDGASLDGLLGHMHKVDGDGLPPSTYLFVVVHPRPADEEQPPDKAFLEVVQAALSSFLKATRPPIGYDRNVLVVLGVGSLGDEAEPPPLLLRCSCTGSGSPRRAPRSRPCAKRPGSCSRTSRRTRSCSRRRSTPTRTTATTRPCCSSGAAGARCARERARSRALSLSAENVPSL